MRYVVFACELLLEAVALVSFCLFIAVAFGWWNGIIQ